MTAADIRQWRSSLAIRTRVRTKTSAGGCYHDKTGTVVRVLNSNMRSLDLITSPHEDKSPYWYRVQFDEPADNGGTKVSSDIFIVSELYPLEGAEPT